MEMKFYFPIKLEKLLKRHITHSMVTFSRLTKCTKRLFQDIFTKLPIYFLTKYKILIYKRMIFLEIKFYFSIKIKKLIISVCIDGFLRDANLDPHESMKPRNSAFAIELIITNVQKSSMIYQTIVKSIIIIYK